MKVYVQKHRKKVKTYWETRRERKFILWWL